MNSSISLNALVISKVAQLSLYLYRRTRFFVSSASMQHSNALVKSEKRKSACLKVPVALLEPGNYVHV